MDAPDLAPFVGTWVGTWRTWVVPDVLHDESPITAEIRPLLAGRDLLLTYEAAIRGDPVGGTALIRPPRLSVEAGRLVMRHWNEGPGIAKYLGVEAVLARR